MTSPAPSPQPSPRASSQANPPADPRANPQDPPAQRSADPHRRPAPRGPSAPQPDRAPRATPAQTSRGTPVTFGSASWLVVLAAVALVQVTRHAWTDTAVLLGVLLVLVVDASGRLAHGAVRVASTGPVVIGVAVLAGLVLAVAPRHGSVAGFVVSAAGAGALAYAWPDRPDEEPAVWDRPTSRTALAWSTAWIAGCLWELAMFVLGNAEKDGGSRYPAASDLLDPLLANPLAKALFVVVWLSVGVGLLARTDRR